MLTVVFTYDELGDPAAVEASGHANWAELGRDIICAAASAVLQSAWLGLSEVAGIVVEGGRTSGSLSMRWSPADRKLPAVAVLIKTADLSIARLAVQYPKHLRYERRTC